MENRINQRVLLRRVKRPVQSRANLITHRDSELSPLPSLAGIIPRKKLQIAPRRAFIVYPLAGNERHGSQSVGPTDIARRYPNAHSKRACRWGPPRCCPGGRHDERYPIFRLRVPQLSSRRFGGSPPS